MRLLIMAAIRSRNHLPLALLTMLSLIFMSIADNMEKLSLGVIANNGADFFALFSSKKSINGPQSVDYQVVEERWAQIDKDNKGYITKYDAQTYLASSKKDNNPLQYLINTTCAKLDLQKNLFVIIWALVIIALIKAIILFFSRYLVQMLSIKVTRDLRRQFFEHIQSLPLSFYQEHNLGSLTARAVGDAGQIASSLNSCLTNYVQTPFVLTLSLYLCFSISWQLSLIIFFGLPAIIFPIIFLTKKVRKVARQMQRNQESFTSVLLDFLSGILTVKIFAMEKFTLQKFNEQNERIAKLEKKSAKYSLLTRPILHTITTVCLATVLIIGLYYLNMSVAQLLMFCALLHSFYEPVKKFAEENANVQRGVIAAERMFEVLHLKPAIKDVDGAKKITAFNDKIVFNNVSFKYKDDWVLKDVSFEVKQGQTIALVGATGAGKSTIVQLLPRLFEPQKGFISIDGEKLQSFTQESLRELIAFVPQRPFLFYDTIFENIRFGRPYSFEEVEQAAIKAHAHEFIVELGETYNHTLMDAGKNLSGGQRQRLTIARALIKNAPILVLDEATSALDAISESKIKQALEEQKNNMTQIIIAHRLTTISHADKIIMLDKGRVIAQGTKDELLASCLPFKRMWDHFHRVQNVRPASILE